jgi:hypothetical protein
MFKLLAAFFVLTATAATAGDAQREDYYSAIWCAENSGVEEVRTSQGTRVDCLLEDYAVEVDFDTKWAEGLGQALHYGVEFDRPAAVLLIIQNHAGKDRSAYIQRLESTIAGAGLNVTVFTIETADYPLR